MKNLAISYAQKGWLVFPLIPNSKKPLTVHGLKDASKDISQITKWWRENPKANIGICAGKESGFVVVDVDVKNGAKGLESLKRLNLPPTLTAKTPSGGWHFFYAYSQGLSNRTNLYPGIDFKTDGGYVVGAGSKLEGISYEWSDPDHPIEPLPKIIVDAFKIQKSYIVIDEKEQITSGGRNARLTSMAGAMRRQGMTATEMLPSLLTVNGQKCNPPLSEEEVISIAQSVSRYSLPASPDKNSIRDKILARLQATDEHFKNMECNNTVYEKVKITFPDVVEKVHLAGEKIDRLYESYDGNFSKIDRALSDYHQSWATLFEHY